jgi:3-hydroxybutyryl-CoA dehydratase
VNKILEYNVNDLYEGMVENFEFVVTNQMMENFSELSGDFNPLHINTEYAISKGFEGSVVYGGILITQISKIIGMYMPGNNSLWSGLSINFLNPLMINQKASIDATVVHISEATSSFKLNIRILYDEITVLKGSADIIIL